MLLNLIFYCLFLEKNFSWSLPPFMTRVGAQNEEATQHTTHRARRCASVSSRQLENFMNCSTHNTTIPIHHMRVRSQEIAAKSIETAWAELEGIEFDASGDLSRNLYVGEACRQQIEGDEVTMTCNTCSVLNAHPSRRLRSWSQHLFMSYQVNALGRN